MPEREIKLECECGWGDVFSGAWSGLQIHCPRCGRRHRIPTFAQSRQQIDISVMNRLLGQPRHPTRVNFRALFPGVLAISALAAVLALLFVRPLVPNAVAIAGGAAAWPAAILVAWWGQKRHLKRLYKDSVQEV